MVQCAPHQYDDPLMRYTHAGSPVETADDDSGIVATCMTMNRPHRKQRLQTQLSAGTRIQQEIAIWLQFSSPFFHTLLSSGVLRWRGLYKNAS